MTTLPKISIITVVFNAKHLIERTVMSVVFQRYNNIEYIIVDGGSTDGTLAVIEKYKRNERDCAHPASEKSLGISKIISEKDKGIYDAMNKGLAIATGDYVLFLNAGDELFDKATLSKVFFEFNNADVYYGSTAIVNEQGQALGDRRLKPPTELTWRSLRYGMCVSHQSFIAKRSICGVYNTRYKVSADIDWMIATLKKANVVVNTNIYISKYLKGGTSHNRRKQALGERFGIMVKQYGIFQTLWSHVVIVVRYPVHLMMKKTMT